jgi:EAL domain-containing protein (putative c-di-GMP-specific phosphodiesterase class I)
VPALGQQLREVLPPRRLHSVSVWDHDANILWLSEGALGPDEQAVIVEALEALGAGSSSMWHESGLEDGRYALILPVRAPTGALVGLAMILADSRSVGDDTLERLSAAPVRTIMQRLAVLLKPDDPSTGAITTEIPVLELDPPTRVEAATLPPAPEPPPSAAAAAPMSDREVNEILEFELAPEDVSRPARARRNGSAAHRTAETSSEMLSLEFLSTESPAVPDLEDIPVLHAAPVEAVAPVTREAPSAPVAEAAPPPAAPVAPAARAASPARAAYEARTMRAAPAVRVIPAHQAPPVPEASSASETPPAAKKESAAPAAPAIVTTPVNDANLILEVLPYAKLRVGGQTRRFQVIPRLSAAQRDPAALDALILQRLLGWLGAHRSLWNSQPTSFTVNLSIATLEDERFAHRVAAALNAHGIAGETVGFEIAEALCAQRRAQVERFIAQCEKLGAWVVIDDFSFDSQVLPLLRSKALRLVKIDAKLSSSALKDKLSQSLVVAAVQAAKVLGIHCAAKRVDTQAALQWLTAIGFDFAQGAAVMPAQPLDALASSNDLTLPGTALRST